MGKYCLLQIKRISRFLPFALCVVLILFGCLSLVFQAMIAAQEDPSESLKVQVGLVGTAGDKYLQWGLAAMQFDSAMLSIDIETMDEAHAAAALERGEIAAYIVFPEGFIEDAFRGDVQKLRFVSTAGATGLVSIIKEEVTHIIDAILVACQQGSYGVGEALGENGYGHLWGQHVNDLSLEYVDYIFDRSKIYQVEQMPRHGGVQLEHYLLGGLTVLLLMLSCLPFAPLFLRSDHALSRMLCARRISPLAQTLAEFAAYFAVLSLLMGAVAAMLQLSGLLADGCTGWELFLRALPGICMITAFTYLMYSICENLVSGVLLCFFGMLALCFVGGCMYPAWFFPKRIQYLAEILPTGIARSDLTACFMGADTTGTGALLAYAGAFLTLSVIVRFLKTGRVRG